MIHIPELIQIFQVVFIIQCGNFNWNKIHNIHYLGFSILFGSRHELRQIAPEMLQNVRNGMLLPICNLLRKKRCHFEHLLH
jgi:hypothetical protein